MFGIGRNKITEVLRRELGDEYDDAVAVVRNQIARRVGDARKGHKCPHTSEWNSKISASQRGRKVSLERKEQIKKTWQDVKSKMSVDEVKAQYSKIAASNRGKKRSEAVKSKMRAAQRNRDPVSEETRAKMRAAKQRFYENGGQCNRKGVKLSDEEKHVISEMTKRMWADGKFSWGDGSNWRSKLEIAVFEEVTKSHAASHSFRLSENERTYVFDIHVPELRLLIEVNGDYWHLNPEFFRADHVDIHRNISAYDLWSRDEQKRLVGETNGYHVYTLWESDIKTHGLETCVSAILTGSARR